MSKEKFTLPTSDIVDIYSSFVALSGRQLPIWFEISNNVNELEPIAEKFNDMKWELITEHAETKKLKPKGGEKGEKKEFIKLNNGKTTRDQQEGIRIHDIDFGGDEEKVGKEWKKMNEDEKEVELHTINKSDLVDGDGDPISLSPDIMKPLIKHEIITDE